MVCHSPFFSISCFTALHGGIILLNIESTVKKSMKIRSMSPDGPECISCGGTGECPRIDDETEYQK